MVNKVNPDAWLAWVLERIRGSSSEPHQRSHAVGLSGHDQRSKRRGRGKRRRLINGCVDAYRKPEPPKEER